MGNSIDTATKENQERLRTLLRKACPSGTKEEEVPRKIAELVGVSRWSVYKWILQARLHPRRVARIVEISKIGEPPESHGRVTRDEFAPFIYNY
jgi:hypothetical protein